MEHKYSAERRQHIYDAAIRLFKEKGYRNTKISDICEAAQVPVGSIYHYYKNKDSFLLEYAKTLGTKGHQILDDSDLSADPVEILSEYYIYKSSILDEAGYILCRDINDRFNNIWMSNYEYNEYSGVRCLTPVSYTHLDVYKRQVFCWRNKVDQKDWSIESFQVQVQSVRRLSPRKDDTFQSLGSAAEHAGPYPVKL